MPCVERQARRTGLAAHRPQVGVAGERALGVDDDAAALVDELAARRRAGRAALRRRRALHRDLPGLRGATSRRTGTRNRLRLRHEPRRAAELASTATATISGSISL